MFILMWCNVMQCNAMWCGTLCNVTTASKWSAYSMLRRVEWIQSNSIQFNSMDSHLLRDITRQRDEPNATFLQNLYDSIAIVLNFKKRKHADHKWMSVLLIPKETHNSNSNNNTWSFDNHCIALHCIASHRIDSVVTAHSATEKNQCRSRTVPYHTEQASLCEQSTV